MKNQRYSSRNQQRADSNWSSGAKKTFQDYKKLCWASIHEEERLRKGKSRGYDTDRGKRGRQLTHRSQKWELFWCLRLPILKRSASKHSTAWMKHGPYWPWQEQFWWNKGAEERSQQVEGGFRGKWGNAIKTWELKKFQRKWEEGLKVVSGRGHQIQKGFLKCGGYDLLCTTVFIGGWDNRQSRVNLGLNSSSWLANRPPLGSHSASLP